MCVYLCTPTAEGGNHWGCVAPEEREVEEIYFILVHIGLRYVLHRKALDARCPDSVTTEAERPKKP